MGYSLAVGHVTLTHAVMVRLHLAQPKGLRNFAQAFSVLSSKWTMKRASCEGCP